MVEKVPPIAAGVPAGGTTGQVLAKASNNDNEVVWAPASGIPAPANPGDNSKALVANAGTYSWQILGAAGGGVPTGGSTNQVLKKNSATPYDYSWGTAPGAAPAGGTTGQVLTKTSNSDYFYSWQTPAVVNPDWNRVLKIQGTNWYATNALLPLETCMNFGQSESRFKIRWQGLYGRSTTAETSFDIVWLCSNGYTVTKPLGNMPRHTAPIGTNRYRHSFESELVSVRNKTVSAGIIDVEILMRETGFSSAGDFVRTYAITIPGYAPGTYIYGFRLVTPLGNEADGGNIEVFIGG